MPQASVHREPYVSAKGEREPGIWRRFDAQGREVLEVQFRDAEGRQRRRKVDGGIMAARRALTRELDARGRGDRLPENPRLRFAEAADRWLDEQVSTLRPATQRIYRIAIDHHLRSRWGGRRLDKIDVADAARLVAELRAAGKSEWTIAGVLKAASRVFRFAQRRLRWHGPNPLAAMEAGERPHTRTTPRRRIFAGDELAQTLHAAHEPFTTLFAFAAVTGARLSECLGVVWADVELADVDEAAVSFEYQVDGAGRRQALKTEESRRTVELPRSLAAALLALRARSGHSQPASFVFATRTGRPLGQRNVLRELRRAMRAATTDAGRPAFPALHAVDVDGQTLPAPRGAVPNFHSFRHTAASEAIAAGDGAEEVSWQLGHRNSNVTRAVYVQEIKSAERRARRRAKMESRYGSRLAAGLGCDMAAPDSSLGDSAAADTGGELVDLQAKRSSGQ